uniref:Chromo domain-containing protein n=1 Tax=Heterorhabditis bacteriophora TaxID=37862 RepID=A0A1I7XCC3_HETBA
MAKSLVDNECNSDSDGEEFVVERILSKRIKRGSLQYLIKWKGYDELESTWEDKKDCKCPKLIQEYEETNGIGSSPKVALKTFEKSTKRSIIRSDQGSRYTRSPSISSRNAKQYQQGISHVDHIEILDDPMSQTNVTSTSKLNQSGSRRSSATPRTSRTSMKLTVHDRNYGICNGRKISRILGLNMQGKELQMLVLYGGVNTKHMTRNNTELVPSRIVHQYEPQLVLKYYESLIVAKNA